MQSVLMLTQEILLSVASLVGGWFGETNPTTVLLATSASTAVAQATDYVWSGRTRDGAGEWKLEPLSPTFARDLRRDLAALRVEVEVDRALEGAAAKLTDLWARATRRDAPERKDLLVEVLVARVALARVLNDTALGAPRALPATDQVKGREMVAASAAELGLAAEVENDARVVALRKPAAGSPRDASARTPSGDRLASLVRDAVERGDPTLGENLGERAVPYLEQMITADLESFPELQRDPLWHLVRIHSARASELVARTLDVGGPVWKARILRVMGNQNILAPGEFNWPTSRGPDARITSAAPRWIDVVERLVADPTTQRDVLDRVRFIAMHDGITPGLQNALVTILLDPATRDAAGVARAVSSGDGWPSVTRVMRGALASPHAEVRRIAIVVLCSSKDQGALIEAASHSDPFVRMCVAQSLVSRYVISRRPDQPTESTRTAYDAPMDDATRGALLALTRDAATDVRAAAAEEVARSKQPFDAAVYEALARDADSKVRASVLSAAAITDEQRARLALGLAADGDAQVLARLDAQLQQVWTNLPKGEPTRDDWLEVLRVRHANPVAPIDGESPSTMLQVYFQRDTASPKEFALLAEWALAGRPTGALSALAIRLHRATSQSSAVDTGLDDATWAKIVRVADADPASRRFVLPMLHRSLVRRTQGRAADFLPLAADAKLSYPTRWLAASIARDADGARMADTILDLVVAGGAPGSVPLDGDVYGAIDTAPSRLDETNGRKLVDALLRVEPRTNPLVPRVLIPVLARVEPTAEQAARLLERWIDDVDVSRGELLTAPLRVVARLPRDQQGDWLLRAARVKPLASCAFDLIGDLRDDSYVPFLESVLTGEVDYVNSADSAPARSLSSLALNALTRYFDARAAKIILEVAGKTRYPTMRDDCFKALETLRAYEAEKGRMVQDQTERAAMQAAVRELAGMLNDADPGVRLQSVRGLASLGAREQLPAIVKLLKDADPGVRQAASQALDVLNAPPKAQ